MRISQLAERLGTAPATIRFYEEAGILPPASRAENRYRQYGEDDLRRVQLVLALRRLDVPLDEIRHLARSCFEHRCAHGTRQLLAVVDRRSAEIHGQIRELQSLADRFAELKRRLMNEGGQTMTMIQDSDLWTKDVACECGCAGSGCTCGCSCCLPSVEHDDHAGVVEVLAQSPSSSCACGCC